MELPRICPIEELVDDQYRGAEARPDNHEGWSPLVFRKKHIAIMEP